MNTKRYKVKLTKTQYIDGVLHTVDPKNPSAAPVLQLREEHARVLVEDQCAAAVDSLPETATPPQPGETSAAN